MKIELLNIDCMEYMAGCADNSFDLAIVDPEFGIGISRSNRLVTDKGLRAKSWDDKPIKPKYFTELFRISNNQIIWGGNYYDLPPTKHCLIWDKKQPESLSFGMFDFAWTSYAKSNKIFYKSVQDGNKRIHPQRNGSSKHRKQSRPYNVRSAVNGIILKSFWICVVRKQKHTAVIVGAVLLS